MQIKDKNILIFGASGGIGSAIAKDLLNEGANMFLHYNTKKTPDPEGLDNAKWFKADVKNTDEVGTMFDQIESIDVFIYVAGIEKSSNNPLDLEKWKEIFDVNLFGAVTTTSHVLKKLNGDGVLIYISSLVGNPNVTFESDSIAYPASKAGLNKLVEGLTAMYGDKIRACAISPGYVRTQMWERLGEETTKEALEYVPTKKFIEPDEVASLVKEVIKNDSLSGSNLVIDKGLGLRKIY